CFDSYAEPQRRCSRATNPLGTQRHSTRASQTALRYGVIAADPLWNFRTNKELSPGPLSILNHYDVMKLDELTALPITNYAARDCALFLWCAVHHLQQGMNLIDGELTVSTYHDRFSWIIA